MLWPAEHHCYTHICAWYRRCWQVESAVRAVQPRITVDKDHAQYLKNIIYPTKCYSWLVSVLTYLILVFRREFLNVTTEQVGEPLWNLIWAVCGKRVAALMNSGK